MLLERDVVERWGEETAAQMRCISYSSSVFNERRDTLKIKSGRAGLLLA